MEKQEDLNDSINAIEAALDGAVNRKPDFAGSNDYGVLANQKRFELEDDSSEKQPSPRGQALAAHHLAPSH